MVTCSAVRLCGAESHSTRHPYCQHSKFSSRKPQLRWRERDRISCRVAQGDHVQPFPFVAEHQEREEGETKATVEEDSENLHQIIHDLSAAPYQQTLNRSFTLGGLGLHTGEEVVVRVRPAFAGDGRYFVRVPKGTNAHLAIGGDRLDEAERALGRSVDPELDQKQTAAFMQYSKAQDEQGYPGTFEQYILDAGLDVPVAGLQPVEFDDTQEEPVRKPTDGSALDASVRNFAGRTPFCQLLGSQNPDFPDLQVAAAEVLLGVMEGLHVDNARIEFEGACEMPILDGSGQFWVEQIAAVGLTPAYKEGDAEEELVRKQSWRPNTPICVFDHDSFITLYPAGLYRRITAGVEPLDCPVIGSQWFSLEAQAGSEPVSCFAVDVAPARTWLSSVELAYAARDAGYLKAGTPDCVMVADGESWRDNAAIRFYSDEPARHAVMDLMGDLALLGDGGHSGLPCGHLVAFNASHDLVMDFVIHCAEAIEAGDVQQFPFMLLPSEMDYVRQVQMEMMDDMLERADFEGAPYKREPFAGEGGEYAEDQPMEELSPAQAQVRREIDILREGVDERFQKLHEEAEEIERDAAAEIAAVKRGETPKPRAPEYIMYKDVEEDDEDDDVAEDGTPPTYVHEDEFEKGGLLRLVDESPAEGGQAEGGSKGAEDPPKDSGDKDPQ